MAFSSQRSSSSISGSRTPPTISKPIPQEPIIPVAIAKPMSSSKPPAPLKTSTSPSKSSRLHRPSITSPMVWLGRSISSASSVQSYAPAKPMRISEPQLEKAYQRSGTLGAGAIVVRTPQEALAGTRHDAVSVRSLETNIPEEEESQDDGQLASPASPPLPPLPLDDEETHSTDFDDDEDEVRTMVSRSSTPPRPSRPCPPAPGLGSEHEPSSEPNTPQSLRPSLKVLDNFPPVPALPANLSPSPPAPPFEPILLSAIPTGVVDPDKVLVTIETCNVTYRTTFRTLTSRPSFLSSYLESLMPSPPSVEDDDEESIYSRPSAVEGSFNSIFRNHLTTAGLLPPSTCTIHIFLDRPSAPYAHILSYLRTPRSTPEHPAVLPRPVQLTSSSSSRLEALLELRDEARYLDLDELYKVCSDELRARHYLGLTRGSHVRGMSGASASGSSIRSLGTLRENDEMEGAEVPKPRRLSRDSGVGSSSSSSDKSSRRGRSPVNSIVGEVGWHSPPPTAMFPDEGAGLPRKFSSLRVRPTGEWI